MEHGVPSRTLLALSLADVASIRAEARLPGRAYFALASTLLLPTHPRLPESPARSRFLPLSPLHSSRTRPLTSHPPTPPAFVFTYLSVLASLWYPVHSSCWRLALIRSATDMENRYSAMTAT